MTYFYYASDILYNFDEIRDYIVKYHRGKNYTLAEVNFDDENCEDFFEKSGINKMLPTASMMTVCGKDGYFYNITENGIVKDKKYSANIPKLMLKSQIRNVKICKKDVVYKEKVLKHYPADEIIKTGNGLFGYNKFLFADKEKNHVVPFRFRKAKKKHKPLIVYFAGAGTLGHDNFKQLSEYINFGSTQKFIKADCNILVPQALIAADCMSEEEARERFTGNCTDIINQLAYEYDIDRNRIYLYGCSFGAGCVWNMLVNHPDMFAGAVEAMGCYFGYKKFEEIDFQSLAEVPIWMAHSSDDECVCIDSDDRFYDALQANHANVKYSRWDKYGHKMAGRFFRQEKWADWLLSQSK